MHTTKQNADLAVLHQKKSQYGDKNASMQMSRYVILLMCSVIILALPDNACAQSQDGGGLSQFGFFIGRALPNNIDGADEIFEYYGLRYSLPAGGKSGYYDFAGTYADDENVKWMGVSFGFSVQIPVETLIGHAGLGIDYTQVDTATTSSEGSLGAHFIGGVMSNLDSGVLVRFDMKFNSRPGTSLFFALGVVFEM